MPSYFLPSPYVNNHNLETKWMIVRYVIAWLPMVVIGIINGVIREQWYGNYLSELSAHQVSTVTGAVLFGLYIWAISRIWRLESGVQSLSVGFIWLTMTVCFEFFFWAQRSRASLESAFS